MTDYDDYWNIHSRDFCINLPPPESAAAWIYFVQPSRGKKSCMLDVRTGRSPGKNSGMANSSTRCLEELTSDLYGLDIECNGIGMMRREGIRNLFVQDICSICENESLIGKKFDCIVISEVIEHLVNPGQALASIREFVSRTNPACEIIFTVPNYQNFLSPINLGLRGKECVHPDHMYYFSYRTFRTLLEQCGFRVTDFHFIIYTERSGRYGGIPLKVVSRFFSALAPHLYFTCRMMID